MEQREWEKRFDETFTYMDDGLVRMKLDSSDIDGLKDFISSELSTARAERDAELREKIEKLIDANDDGMWTGLLTAVHILSFLTPSESEKKI